MDQPAAVRITLLGASDVSIEVAGDLTADRLDTAASRLRQLAMLAFERITLDVSATGPIDHAGASLLLEFITDSAFRGGEVHLVDVTGEVTDLGSWMTAHDPVESAGEAPHAA